jgi:hypothetical protein
MRSPANNGAQFATYSLAEYVPNHPLQRTGGAAGVCRSVVQANGMEPTLCSVPSLMRLAPSFHVLKTRVFGTWLWEVLRKMLPLSGGGGRPLFEPHFSTHSDAFHPGRHARMALAEVEEAHRESLCYGVDGDLKSFFDTVHHSLLMNRLAKRLSDRRVLRLLGRYLRSGFFSKSCLISWIS